MNVEPVQLPKHLTEILREKSKALTYTPLKRLFYVVWMGGKHNYAGVFGDGENATYEWFFFQDGKLKTSNEGYGHAAVALRDVLMAADL